jgi:sulfoxide reductase heme-binding subunit YedZ
MLGPRPFTEAIHQSGQWTVRLLAATLAITPLRYATRLNKLISVRRMLGLAVFAYALLHFTLNILDQHGDILHLGREIALRIYLTMGFVALCGLSELAATSTDASIKRLGCENWNRLHKIVYAVAFLGTVHFFMQSKLDVTEAILMGGIFALLLAERLARRRSLLPPPVRRLSIP